MKVLGINGSPRKEGNTSILIREVFSELEKSNIKTELFQLGGKPVKGCIGCNQCQKVLNGHCQLQNDTINALIDKIKEADAILIGSPVYFSDVTTEIKAMLDVSGRVLKCNGKLLSHKIGAGIVSGRRTGHIHTLNTINNFLLVNEMIVPGNTYWNMGIGKDAGDVLKDEEGLETMRNLGKNMTWLLQKIKAQ